VPGLQLSHNFSGEVGLGGGDGVAASAATLVPLWLSQAGCVVVAVSQTTAAAMSGRRTV
jgi:hypothetical protein